MKKILTAATIAALLFTACDGNNKYEIKGTTSQPDGTVVKLISEGVTIDSTLVKNGAFTFSGPSTKTTFVNIAGDGMQNNQFFLEAGTINVDMDKCEATGTPMNNDFNDLGIFVNSLREQLMNGVAEDSIDVLYTNYLTDLSSRHVGDQLGLLLVQDMASDMSAAELDSVRNLCDLYREDPRLAKYAESKIAVEATAPGKKYIDVKGINAKTGEEQAISDILKEGLPVVVDFWASWCGPCRREISNYLSQYAQIYSGRCNFVSIAVWEESIEDTKKAMGQLPITWPVIYCGERENGPTDKYGINAIPQIILIAPDGTIVARDLRGPGIADAIDEVAP